MTKVAVLVGSLRKESYSRKLANNLVKMFPDNYRLEFMEIGNLPFYNEDYDAENNVPDEYITFRNKMKAMDAVLFVTPEYNRSFPAVLKNALDVGSRPYGQSVFDGKPALIVSQSIGDISGFGANHHLRQVLTFLNMPVVQQPEAYIGRSAELFDANGNIKDEDTVQYLKSVVNAFVDLIKKFKS